MPQIVKPNPGEAGALQDRGPWALKVGSRLLNVVAWDDVGADAAESHREGRGIENNGFLTRFAVRQE